MTSVTDPVLTDVRIEGATTSVPGRFLISDETFQIVTDASKAKGGRAQAPGTSHLIGGALVTCALNVFRGAVEPELETDREVHIVARFQRRESQTNLGSIHLDVKIAGVDQAEADRLRQLYVDSCSIYQALTATRALDITLSASPY
jgi:organic hydroperoxide reductase OsmC/OhrA